MAKGWEDFLNAFDKGQDDVKVSWGPNVKPAPPKDRRKQQAANMDKFVGGGAKPTAVNKISPKDQERIRKLEAMLNDKGTTEGEKEAVRNVMGRITNK
jgi:hypothetical protein